MADTAQEDYDLRIARLKKTADSPGDIEEEKKKEWEEYKAQIVYEVNKLSGLSFERKVFCRGLFTMLLPSGLFQEPMEEGNVWLFRCAGENMTLAVRVADGAGKPDAEKLKADYADRMRDSGQQTKIDLSGEIQTQIGTAVYFTAIHSMPEEDLCDFILLFEVQAKTVIMDFGFSAKEYRLWKVVIRKLSSTIAGQGGETVWEKENT